MSTDGSISPRSGAVTPEEWPHADSTTSDANYLKADAFETPKATKAYLAGSKALDSLSRMIISTESFFHPSNSGTWTADLSAFIKYLTAEFNKREANLLVPRPYYILTHSSTGWHEERQPDCKTPQASYVSFTQITH